MAAPREETHQYGQKLSRHTNSGTDPKLLARLHKGLGTIRQKKAPLGSGAFLHQASCACTLNGLSGNSGAWGSALTDLRHAPSHSA